MANKRKKRNFKAYIMLFVCMLVFSFVTLMAESPSKENEEPVISEQKNIEGEPKMIFVETEKDIEDEVAPLEEPVEEEYVFSFSYPLEGEIIEEFSGDKLVYSKTLDDWRVHNGIDIKAKLLERVHACERGIVEKVYEDKLMGKTIIIDHENGYKTVYSNLSSTEMVDNGEAVEKGTVISGVGDTALAESAQEIHIHFQIIKDGVCVDPQEYIN